MYAAKRSRVAGCRSSPRGCTAANRQRGAPPELARSPIVTGANQLELLGELRRAISRSELCLVYQPQIDLRTSQIVATEALVRWDHPGAARWAQRSFCPWFGDTA